MARSDRIIVVAGSAVTLFILSNAGYGLKPPVLGVTVSALATAAMFAVLACGLLMLNPTRRGDVQRRLGLVRGRLGWPAVLLAILGTMALSNLLEALIGWMELSEMGTLAKLDADLAGARGAALSGTLLGVALASGTAEELFFRGYVQRGIERRLGGRRGASAIALLLASAAFAVAHFDPVHSPAAFVLGLYLGGITHLADSLWPAILCHVTNNTLAVLDSAFAPDLPAPGPVRALLAATVVAASLILAVRQRSEPLPPATAPLQEAATAGPSIDRP
jgi:membrane protease YdiL (CAAX protease family)